MKFCEICGRKVSSCWNLAFSLSLMLGLPHSHASTPSMFYMNLTLHWGKWAMSEVYHTAWFEEKLPPEKLVGVLVVPEGEPKDACSLETNFNVPPNTEAWIAFIARGGCTFKDKIKVAARKGATGVIIYDHPCPDRQILILTHEDEGDTVAIMISSLKVKQILRLIQERIRVTAVVQVGTTKCFWKIYLCACSLILTFIGYVVLFCSPRQIVTRHEERRTQASKAELQEAIHSLESRRLKHGEVDLAGETCVVCLEAYRPKQIVRILTCRHVFHKRCIDRWLLKRGICPICNYAIFQRT